MDELKAGQPSESIWPLIFPAIDVGGERERARDSLISMKIILLAISVINEKYFPLNWLEWCSLKFVFGVLVVVEGECEREGKTNLENSQIDY